jgi:small subunit ribosomal protein S11
MAAKNTTKKKASVIVTPNAKALVSCTYNNTIITIVNQNGETIVWCAPGVIGFKGAKRSTPYAATLTAEEAAKKAVEKGVQSIDIIVKGPGNSKLAAIKGLKSAGLKVRSIKDRTPVPHNGCKPRKRARK